MTYLEKPLDLQPLHIPILQPIKEKDREDFLTQDSSSVPLIIFTEHLNTEFCEKGRDEEEDTAWGLQKFLILKRTNS